MIFYTESGPVGLGPSQIRPGEIVVRFPGSKIPMILRPRDTHFLLIGACYAFGYMERPESDVDNWCIEEQIFELH